MRYPDICEVVTGLVVKGIYPPNAVPADELLQPYDDMVRFLQKSKSTPEKLIQKFGLVPYQAAEQAAASLNGTTTSDWLAILHEAHSKYCLGDILEHNGRRLKEGKDADYAKIATQLTEMDTDEGHGQLLSTVENDFIAFQPSGYEPFDTHFGGMPHQGLSVWGAKSKSGKTTLLIDVACANLQFQTKKDIAIFSLEMLDQEFKARASDLGFPKRLMNRIVIWDGVMTAADVAAEASKEQLKRSMAGKNPIGLIGVDFADLMVVDEENSEAVFANIYRIMARLAKSLSIPVILLSQLSGAYQGGLPKPNHLRYTRLAEALAWQILMLYNPNTDWSQITDVDLPLDAGYGYILGWACRGGFGKHKGPGAIRMAWDGGRGWGKKSEGWFDLVKVE
jgi:hypothetical protein